MKDFENELLRVMEVYNKAWEDNWGFVPMTDDEFKHIAKMFKAIIDKDLVFFAEAGGKPVGFSLAFPDVNQALIKLNGRLFPFGIFKFLSAKKKINIMRMLTMGVITEYQRKGIDAVFVQNTIDEGLAKGYFGAEISWILEDNIPMVRTAVNLGADKYKTYRIYDKKIV
jgi:GNAT superfamily N-acetyltransferase